MKSKTSARAKSKRSVAKSKGSAANGEAPRGSRFFNDLLTAVREMAAIRRGEALPSRFGAWCRTATAATSERSWTPRRGSRFPAPEKRLPGLNGDALAARKNAGNEAVQARTKLGLSQQSFAALLGVSPGTLQGWEQGRRQPNRAARVLLRVAAKHPKAVLSAARSAA